MGSMQTKRFLPWAAETTRLQSWKSAWAGVSLPNSPKYRGRTGFGAQFGSTIRMANNPGHPGGIQLAKLTGSLKKQSLNRIPEASWRVVVISNTSYRQYFQFLIILALV